MQVKSVISMVVQIALVVYTSDGTAYAPADVPSNVANTYYAVNPVE